MFAETITLSDAVNGIKRIVERDGRDHTAGGGESSGCVYAMVKDGALVSVCIVGRFFGDRGALRALMDTVPSVDRDHEPSQFGACISGNEMWANLTTCGIEVETDARTFLRYAQEAQDGGAPWGEAFDSAVSQMQEVLLTRVRRQEYVLFNTDSLTAPVEPVAVPAPATSEPLADWERELLAGDDGVVRVEVGRIVRISEEPGYYASGEGFVHEKFHGAKGEVVKKGIHGQFEVVLLDEDNQRQPRQFGGGDFTNTIHENSLTVIG